MAKIANKTESNLTATKVKLLNKALNVVEEFDIAWAERILNLQERWADKPYRLEDTSFEYKEGMLFKLAL